MDFERCTSCGDCEKACTLKAIQLEDSGRPILEASYCTCCGACARACSEGAIRMAERTCEELVVPDEEAEARKRQQKRAAKARKEGKQALEKGLNFLESLDK